MGWCGKGRGCILDRTVGTEEEGVGLLPRQGGRAGTYEAPRARPGYPCSSGSRGEGGRRWPGGGRRPATWGAGDGRWGSTNDGGRGKAPLGWPSPLTAGGSQSVRQLPLLTHMPIPPTFARVAHHHRLARPRGASAEKELARRDKDCRIPPALRSFEFVQAQPHQTIHDPSLVPSNGSS